QCLSPENAKALSDMMVQVVARGTGTAAQIPGVTVAGKTGTAQTGTGARHAWFTAFAPAEAPRYSVAGMVENGGNLGHQATGGQGAAASGRQVVETLIGGK